MTPKESLESVKTGRIKDARGRAVKVLDPVSTYFLHRHGVIESDVLKAIVNEKGVQIAAAERVTMMVGILSATAVVGFFAYGIYSGDLRDAPYAKLSALVFMCGMPWLAWFMIIRARIDNIAAAMLKYLRCPHCGYDLRLLPVDPADGATVCPECGAAWLLKETSQSA
jgi:hypothetical protein